MFFVKRFVIDSVIGVAGCGLWVASYKLQVAGCGLKINIKECSFTILK